MKYLKLRASFRCFFVVLLCVLWPVASLRAEVAICSENFPDGMQSHANRGGLVFGYNAQLSGSPDGYLNADEIDFNWWSWLVPTCQVGQCQAISPPAPVQNPGNFPSTAGFTENLNIRANRSEGISYTDGTQYRRIRIGDNSQLTINSSGRSFYIEELQLGSESKLTLAPGDYWIGRLTTDSESQIQFSGDGLVRLFVRDSVRLGYRALINSPGIDVAGDAKRLLFFGYQDITFENRATVSGFVYSRRDITLGSVSYLYGALTARNATLGSFSKVYYRQPGTSCQQGSTLLLSWSLDESQWSGAADEIEDSSRNGLNGQTRGGPSPASTSPALPAENGQGTCGYGSFHNTSNQYLETPHNELLSLQTDYTIGVWVRPRSRPGSGTLMSILSKDENYEFHMNSDGTINWWWQTTNPSQTRSFNSSTALPLNTWSHVVIRYTSAEQRIYINGALAGSAHLSGTPVRNSDPLQLGWDQLAGRHFNGELDELRIYKGALSEDEIEALATERHECGLALQCFTDNFDDRTMLGSDWIVSSRGRTAFTPAIASKRLRLTSDEPQVATAAALQRVFPAAGNYVQVSFKYYAYSGSGADGISVVLSDASITPQPGSFGGPLGYGTKGTAETIGFAGGWLGIGIDEYGNFSAEGGPRGPGHTPDSVALRGSGSGTEGYAYIAGTGGLTPGIDAPSSSGAGPGHEYRITIDGRVEGSALVTVERDSGSGFVVLIDQVDVQNVIGQRDMPEEFYLSVTGSTGDLTNIHELDEVQICATEMKPVGARIHHFELSYASPALTCNPHEITIRACMNAECTNVYADEVSTTMSPLANWNGGNPIVFTGGSVTRRLSVTTAGTATLGVISSTPPAQALSQIVCSTQDCKLPFEDSGFVFNVPNLLAAKPASDVVLAAVKKNDSGTACVPGFSEGARTISFSSAYSNPTTGTKPLKIAGLDNAFKDVGSTPVEIELEFDQNAEARFDVRYDDAGQMILNARYLSSSGVDSGLDMAGSSQFVSKPYGLCIQTDIDSLESGKRCDSNDTDCPVFKNASGVDVRAGDEFPLKIKAVGWEADGEPLSADRLCEGNVTTPNFELGNIELSSQRLAPDSGVDAQLGQERYDHVLGEQTTILQTVSEVGIFNLIASPVLKYFDESVSGGTSNRIGRFIPAWLDATGSATLTPSCGSLYSYQGQPIGFAPGKEPRLGITGYNRQGQVTQNYDRGEFWRLDSPAAGSYHSVTETASRDARFVSEGVATRSVLGANDGDGSRTYVWSGESVLYQQPLEPSIDDLPFDAMVEQRFPASSLTDQDGACVGDGSTCKSFSYTFSEDPGTEVRLGRLHIGNAHGSELQALSLPLTLETWQGTESSGAFMREQMDACTTASVLGGPLLDSFTGNLAAGDTQATPSSFSLGLANLALSAPGKGNDGSAAARFPLLPVWLQYPWEAGVRQSAWGLATFGIYKGSKPLIFRREVYGQ